MNYKNNTARIAAMLAIASVGIASSHFAYAQENNYAAVGIHKGSFYYFPKVEVGIGYDDNVFRLPDSAPLAASDEIVVPTKQSDTAIIGTASVTMNSDWNRHALNGIASVNLGRYSDFNSEDYGNYLLGLDGRLDVKRGQTATGRIGYRDQKEDRSSVNSRERVDGTTIFGTEPTQYRNPYIGVGYDYSPARLQVKGDLNYDTLDYDNVNNVFGTDIDNSDRGRANTGATLRIGYEVAPQRRAYVEAKVNTVDYDQQLDNNGIERSSTGYEYRGGMNFGLTNLLVGDVYLGYLEQNYDSSTQEDISSNSYGASLRWFPSRLTGIGLSVDRSVQESTEATASGYLRTNYDLSIDHELRRNITLGGNVDYTNNDFTQNVAGRKENENITGFGLNLRYSFSSRLYTSAEYRHEQRRSDILNQEYTGNRGLLNIGVNW